MTNQQKSDQDGVLNVEMTASPQATPSTNAENPSTLDMSVSKAPQSLVSQRTPNSPNATLSRFILAFAAKLVKAGMVEWKKVTLGSGREGYALFFPTDKWGVDPETKELVPLVDS